MTHAEYLHQMVAEIAEELPGFSTLAPSVQRTLRELAAEYFEEEFVPRLEGTVNIPRYEEAMNEKTAADREFIEDQADFLRSCIIRAQRAAHSQLLEKFTSLTAAAQRG